MFDLIRVMKFILSQDEYDEFTNSVTNQNIFFDGYCMVNVDVWPEVSISKNQRTLAGMTITIDGKTGTAKEVIKSLDYVDIEAVRDAMVDAWLSSLPIDAPYLPDDKLISGWRVHAHDYVVRFIKAIDWYNTYQPMIIKTNRFFTCKRFEMSAKAVEAVKSGDIYHLMNKLSMSEESPKKQGNKTVNLLVKGIQNG